MTQKRDNQKSARPVSNTEKNTGYLQLLKTNSNFRNLWFGQLISAGGDWFNNVALLGLVLQLTGSGFAAGMVLLATSLPHFLLIPIAGPIVDRHNRKHVMLAANFAGAALALVFLLVHNASDIWLVYLGGMLLISTAAFFNPASQAVVPNIVSRRELFSANALSSSTWGVMVMVGSGLGGLVSTVFGRETVFMLNALSFLLSNLLIMKVRLPARLSQTSPAKLEEGGCPVQSATTWSDFVGGLSYLKAHRPVIGLVACKTFWHFAAGVLVLLTIFGQQVFKAGDSGIGLLYAGRGLGALIGPLLVQPLVGTDPARMRVALSGSFLVTGAGYLLLAASPIAGIWLAAAALVLAHSGGGIAWVGSSVLLQQTVPDRYRGRVFAIDLGMNTLVGCLSILVWSLALETGAAPVTMAAIGAAVFLTSGLAWIYLTGRPSFRFIAPT